MMRKEAMGYIERKFRLISTRGYTLVHTEKMMNLVVDYCERNGLKTSVSRRGQYIEIMKVHNG